MASVPLLGKVLMGADWRLAGRWGAGRWRRFRHLPASDFHSVCIVRFGMADSYLLVSLWMQGWGCSPLGPRLATIANTLLSPPPES